MRHTTQQIVHCTNTQLNRMLFFTLYSSLNDKCLIVAVHKWQMDEWMNDDDSDKDENDNFFFSNCCNLWKCDKMIQLNEMRLNAQATAIN